jgi:hypothetical protein
MKFHETSSTPFQEFTRAAKRVLEAERQNKMGNFRR